mgnify:CR=1 FL=1
MSDPARPKSEDENEMPMPASGIEIRPAQLTAAPDVVLQVLPARVRRPVRGLLTWKASTTPP